MEENIPHKNWFGRNWKWVVPTGGCLVAIILFVVFAGTLVMGVTSLLTDSDPYKEAMSKAQENELVVAAIGEPIEQDGMTMGSLNYNNGEGQANLSIPIKGPKGEAVLSVFANKPGDEWIYHLLEVQIKNSGETISLLAPETDLDN
ncbi:cytochrome oxidase complex assembly protein 1 [Ulvibacter sp. MAR_2010_11]|uniref:cytochrome c oxidase assembly factor Coa1 family protein n=1 Tax=Ulvibacter sp. MAR_2010_11 TaxID=1250229 RepID=UPI000C2CB7C8|nr:cytochrome c oxidase assembly factor Coa1 family protein [Ulvibacter sp. MAR_2010_11]PKA82716.1 cytochrome oxidase complex assembly protein 1 [Ulvibacter sp. MAR_2010_11]